MSAPTLPARGVLRLVSIYQRLREDRPSPCRFTPGCSTYLAEAVQEHGAAVGLLLGGRRLARCHPWGGSGHDPVPMKKAA